MFESNKNQSALFLTPKTALKRPQRDQLKTMMHNLSHTLTLMWDIHEEKDEKGKKETRTGLGLAEKDEKNFLCRLSQWDPAKVVPRQNAN